MLTQNNHGWSETKLPHSGVGYEARSDASGSPLGKVQLILALLNIRFSKKLTDND
jgi:hypothetical protein